MTQYRSDLAGQAPPDRRRSETWSWRAPIYARLVPSSTRPDNAPQVLPYLYYADARAAVELLVNVFGFTEITAVRDDEGNVWHADLSTVTAS